MLKNDGLILKEDMTEWRFKNNITIFNMQKNDNITIKVTLLKDQIGTSWKQQYQ